MIETLSLPVVIGLFAAAGLTIAVLGVRLTSLADRLGDRTGLGEAVVGGVLLGLATSLSGTVVSVTAALDGRASLAFSNAVGGIAAQTAFLALADLLFHRVNMEHAAAELASMVQAALLSLLLAVALLAVTGPDIAVLGIHPASLALVVIYVLGTRATARVRQWPMWHPEQTRDTRTDTPEESPGTRGGIASLLTQFLGLALVLGAAMGMPAGRGWRGPGAGEGETVTAPKMLHPRRAPLYATALIFGATNAAYISFAADRVTSAGGLPSITGRADTGAAVLFIAYGLFGLLGLATGWMEHRFGLARLIALIFAAFAASLSLIGLAPGSMPGMVTSAGLHGAAVMMISAVLSMRTLRLFPGRGSVGFTAALLAVALGSVIGPALAGAIISLAGPKLAFLGLALAPLGVAASFLIWPGRAGS